MDDIMNQGYGLEELRPDRIAPEMESDDKKLPHRKQKKARHKLQQPQPKTRLIDMQ
jgi:hypothetical protein